MKTFRIYTLGCKVNQYDSQVIREGLKKAGLKELENPIRELYEISRKFSNGVNSRIANYCIINTCTVTANADRQSRYLIRKAKRDSPLAKIIVTGCYAHSNAADISKIKGVDLILDNENKHRILDFLIPHRNLSISLDSGIKEFQGHARAFVKVQDGCDNFCSFCKVPYVRGRSRSRSFDSIIQETRRLSDNGYKEIVLTGICLGNFGGDTCSLVNLISEIEKLDGILRIRLSSIEAKDVTDKLIAKMKSSAKLCPHLHIPFQSGDNKILKLMNRRDTRESYLKLVKKLKKNVKNMAISCDIMIGFPGEREKEFTNTLDFLKEVKPARVHIFPFQARDLTPLQNVTNNITVTEMKRRYNVIKVLTDDLALQFRKRFLNRRLEVLFEGKKDGFWRGYTPNYLLTRIKNNVSLNNKVVEINIKKVGVSILLG